ncbi:hypothetical protein M406DRAFT_289433 [Cryphonectria parasitica EP155]|uniref:phosphatidylinositol-3,4,5-trisphosphate 3-phosphatase n=1 Tax=Cryphonectria parasitica (strain ATCC 38755 / EP155) TaxID=660469 RepID=A0A9P4Y7E3_CRYP1|nr:uncharacterized protein M406DRAFT_289433 [Cryphonectria parasitica EP155]KAF3768103.1 hypothetical protein M406DRAFT_289433 [Cryphonectria parasitica EP155]
MTSLLRQIVAGPRAKHKETGLDLCYVTDDIIVTSGPSQTYPQRAYRNPLDRVVAFLDAKHGENWAIWEFRAEGTGYPDEAVYGRIRHYPWPDHHPPPFRLVPMITASMRNWLHGDEDDQTTGNAAQSNQPSTHSDKTNDKSKRVVVVHCKAGKGRSGTAACSYLISQCKWTAEDALAQFTKRRMRPNLGAGVSIPSQLRTISYVDRWTKGGKKYVDREIEILEVHVWGLRHGVKISVEGFADEGKKIKVFHTFNKNERLIVQGDAPGEGGLLDFVGDALSPQGGNDDEIYEDVDYNQVVNGDNQKSSGANSSSTSKSSSPSRSQSKKGSRTSLLLRNRSPALPRTNTMASNSELGGMAVILKPTSPIRIPNSDICVSLERRNRAPASMGLTMVTAVAHVWFNAFFEGKGPEQDGNADDSGVFEIEWERMDGIKGSSRKGTKAADKISVLWRAVGVQGPAVETPGVVITEPREGSPVPQMKPADWKGADSGDPDQGKTLGLREADPGSASVSKASSIRSQEVGTSVGSTKEADGAEEYPDDESLQGVKVSGPTGEEDLDIAQERGVGEPSATAAEPGERALSEHEKKVEATKGRAENPEDASGAAKSQEQIADNSPSGLRGGGGSPVESPVGQSPAKDEISQENSADTTVRSGDTTHLGFVKRGKKLLPMHNKHKKKDGSNSADENDEGKDARLMTVHITK